MIRIEALILFHTGCIICSDNSKVFKIGSYLHFNFTNTDLHHRDNHHTNFDFFHGQMDYVYCLIHKRKTCLLSH